MEELVERTQKYMRTEGCYIGEFNKECYWIDGYYQFEDDAGDTFIAFFGLNNETVVILKGNFTREKII